MRAYKKENEGVNTKNLVLGGLFLALGLLMPFLTGQIPSLGSKLLPMHIPVLLCGFICGPRLGLIVGFVTPLLRSLIFTMPKLFPVAVAMAFELAVYGLMAGLIYNILKQRKSAVYISLIISMILGRLVWGLVSYFLYGLSGTVFTWEIFAAGAFLNAIPGIIIQLVIIPIIVIALKRQRAN